MQHARHPCSFGCMRESGGAYVPYGPVLALGGLRRYTNRSGHFDSSRKEEASDELYEESV